MKVILVSYDSGDEFEVYTAQNIPKAMRELWEATYNENLDVEELSEEDTWFEEDQAQIVGRSGEYIAEFKVINLKEV